MQANTTEIYSKIILALKEKIFIYTTSLKKGYRYIW